MESTSSVTITLTPHLQQAVFERAREQQTTPEAIILDAVREKLSERARDDQSQGQPPDEWQKRLRKLASHCGVSLSNEAVSSEGLYD